MMSTQLRRIWSKLQSVVMRGISGPTDDAQPTQTMQVALRYGELADAVEHFQPFGLSFRPSSDSEVIVLSVGASQDNLVVLAATSRAIRPTGVDEGQGGLYDADGWKVFLPVDGTVCLGEKEPVDWAARADRVDRELEAIKQALDTHTHLVPQAPSGTTNSAPSADVSYAPQPTQSDTVKAT